MGFEPTHRLIIGLTVFLTTIVFTTSQTLKMTFSTRTFRNSHSHFRPICFLFEMFYCLWSGLYLNHIEILQVLSSTLHSFHFCHIVAESSIEYKFNFNLGSLRLVSTHCLLYLIYFLQRGWSLVLSSQKCHEQFLLYVLHCIRF